APLAWPSQASWPWSSTTRSSTRSSTASTPTPASEARQGRSGGAEPERGAASSAAALGFPRMPGPAHTPVNPAEFFFVLFHLEGTEHRRTPVQGAAVTLNPAKGRSEGVLV